MSVQNAAAANDALDSLQSEQKQEGQDLRESLSLQKRLERQIADESIDVPVGDEAIGFRPFGREASQFVSLCQEHLENIDEENIEDEFDEVLDRMYAVAAEFSKSDGLDVDWWEANFSIPRIIAVLSFVNTEGKSLGDGELKK